MNDYQTIHSKWGVGGKDGAWYITFDGVRLPSGSTFARKADAVVQAEANAHSELRHILRGFSPYTLEDLELKETRE